MAVVHAGVDDAHQHVGRPCENAPRLRGVDIRVLHAAGLDELVATSWESYEQLATQLATDPARRLAIRDRMRTLAPGWTDAPARFVRSLDDALVRLAAGT